MYSTLITIALFFNIALSGVMAEFAVSTPEITTCKGEEVKVTWEQTNGPYNLLIVAADNQCGDALIDAGDFDKTWANINTNGLKAGDKVLISLEDADGEEGWSKEITVQKCPASTTSTTSASSTSTSSTATGDSVATTLVVSNTYVTTNAEETGGISAVGGAANAANPFGNSNAASVPRHISAPAILLSAIAGAVALLL